MRSSGISTAILPGRRHRQKRSRARAAAGSRSAGALPGPAGWARALCIGKKQTEAVVLGRHARQRSRHAVVGRGSGGGGPQPGDVGADEGGWIVCRHGHVIRASGRHSEQQHHHHGAAADDSPATSPPARAASSHGRSWRWRLGRHRRREAGVRAARTAAEQASALRHRQSLRQ